MTLNLNCYGIYDAYKAMGCYYLLFDFYVFWKHLECKLGTPFLIKLMNCVNAFI